jgi:adenylate kinase family enzyme
MFGAPGSGKGFIGDILANHFQVKVLVASDLIEASRNPKLSTAMEIDKQVANIVLSRIHFGNDDTIAINGFPKNVNQVVAFLNQSSIYRWAIPFALYKKADRCQALTQLLDPPVQTQWGEGEGDIETFHCRYDEFEEATIPAVELLRLSGIVTEELCFFDTEEEAVKKLSTVFATHSH